MTLNTNVHLTGNISGSDAFDLSLKAILTAADRLDEFDTASVNRADNFIGTQIGQGLPGITGASFNADGSNFPAGDEFEDYEWEDDDGVKQSERLTTGYDPQESTVQLSWDTAYGYKDNGIGCSELHARAIVVLYNSLPEGVTLRWQNEYTGEWFDALDGLDTLTRNGAKADDWFRNLAMPAIQKSINQDYPWETIGVQSGINSYLGRDSNGN